MKKILLYILTFSLILTSIPFTATALVRTTKTSTDFTGYTAISTEAQFRAMADGTASNPKLYYLKNDIVITQYFEFPKNIILDGNGHALLPPAGISESNPLLPGIFNYTNQTYDHSGTRILKHRNPGRGTRPSTQSSEIKGENETHWNQGQVGRHTYETVCLFTFDATSSHDVTIKNLSFGTSQRPFWMKDDYVNGTPEKKNNWSGLALFCTNEYVENLTCENVDFHVRVKKEGAGSGNMAGFMSVAYNNTTMINCNMDAEVLGEGISSQAGCFFAQTQNGSDCKLVMTNCTVLAGSLLKKDGQTGGMVGQVSGSATFTRCVNYCDLVQTGGHHAGGIAANLYQGGWNITFDKCINYGTIYAMRAAGGICGAVIGDNEKTSTKTVKATFKNCLNAADIRPVPALVTDIKDAQGNVTGTTRTGYGESCGGILGTYHSFVEVVMDNCINLGIIRAPEKETSGNGYFHASIGQFIGAIGHLYSFSSDTDNYECQCTSAANPPMVNKTNSKGEVVKDDAGNPILVRQCSHGVNKHPYYTEDEEWTWHFTYDALSPTITNCIAGGLILFGENCPQMVKKTGLDKPDTQMEATTYYLLYPQMVGNSVPLDAAKCSGNRSHNATGYHWDTSGDNEQYIKDYNTRELMQYIATNWLVTNGFVERFQMDYPRLSAKPGTGIFENVDYDKEFDDPSLITGPYVIGTPKVAALLSSTKHDNVRIVATINSREYTKVGFNYSFYVYNEQWTEEIRTKPVNQWDEESSFGSVNYWTTAIYENVGELRTANELGGRFLYEMTLLNMPKDKIVRFNIVPKVVGLKDNYFYSQDSTGAWGNRGGELLGQRYNLYFYNGELVRCEISDPYKT